MINGWHTLPNWNIIVKIMLTLLRIRPKITIITIYASMTLSLTIWRLLYFWIMFTRKRKSKSVEEDHVCLGGPLFYFATFCKRRRSFQTSHFIRYFFHEEVHSAFLSRAIQMYVTLPKDAMSVGCLNVPKV